MGFSVVVTGQESAPGLEKKLCEAWRPFLPKIQECHVLRARKGGSAKTEGDRLLRCIKGKFDPVEDGAPDDYLGRLVRAVIDLAETDAGDKRGKYGFAIAGITIAGFSKPQWLTDPIEETVTGSDAPVEASTRESELLATIKTLREWGNDCARNHISAMNAGTHLAEGVVRIAEATAASRGAADTAYWQAQLGMQDRSNDLQIQLEGMRVASHRSDRGYDTLMSIAKMFAGDFGGLIDDVFSKPGGAGPSASSSGAANSAGSSGSAGPSSSASSSSASSSGGGGGGGGAYGGITRDELGQILSGRPEILDMFTARANATGNEHARLTAELRERWVSIPKGEAFAIVRVTAKVLGVQRALKFAKWIRADLGIS